MRHPWANIILLALIILQFVTGFFGFVNGRIDNRWLLWLHGIGAYAITWILLWKASIVLQVYQRGTGLNWRRIAFALMLLLLLATLLFGLLWTFNGPQYLFGFSLVTLHIFLAVPLLLIMAWHAWHLRWIFRAPKAVGRRAVLRGLGAGLAGLGLWWLGDRLKIWQGLPGAERRFTGSYETGSFTGLFPSVSWIADRPSPIDPDTWQLTISGAVEQPLTLSYQELIEMVGSEITAVIDCTGGWYSEQVWEGLVVGRLLSLASPTVDAISVTFEAVSGYKRRFTLQESQTYLLATHVAGTPLTHGHGFPARLAAPDQRGVNWVKWITNIHVNTTPKEFQLPLPLQ
jgi:hypothetical protein